MTTYFESTGARDAETASAYDNPEGSAPPQPLESIDERDAETASAYDDAPEAATRPQGFESTSGFEAAVAEATASGGAGRVDGFVERMAERVGGKASVRAVFGDPIERDGITVIPVARVRWGFGGGAGSGPVPVGPGRPGEAVSQAPAPGGEASGTGGGGAATADPVGYLEIGPDGATFQPILSPRPSPAFMLAAGVTAALVLRGLARLVRR